ncbi:hypothetical protein CEW92_09885 [Bacillaceae bacterium SAS-127]|nr:hypothetical protein CEW92_09885 [Bacillaceae bacterium SAS-127]
MYKSFIISRKGFFDVVNKYFKTGEVAKFHNVSPDTVRYYHKEKLVEPTVVKDNKYRYYTLNDTLKFSSVTWLRELGVPLHQIKDWFTYSDLNEVTSFHSDYIKALQQEKQLIDKKINYLQQFNARMESFQRSPNQLEYVENDFIYICHALSFTADEDGFNIDEPTYEETVDDPFWTKTSIISFTNTIQNSDDPQKGQVCCSNIIPSECDDIEKLKFTRALRYNYIGDTFSDRTYRNRIKTQVIQHCAENNLSLQPNFYELYYLYQNVNECPVYYVHVYFPLQ